MTDDLQARVEKLEREVAQLNVLLVGVYTHAELRAGLTPDQRRRLKPLIEEFRTTVEADADDSLGAMVLLQKILRVLHGTEDEADIRLT